MKTVSSKMFQETVPKKEVMCFCAFFFPNSYCICLNYYQWHFESLQLRDGTASGSRWPGHKKAHDGQSDLVAVCGSRHRGAQHSTMEQQCVGPAQHTFVWAAPYHLRAEKS